MQDVRYPVGRFQARNDIGKAEREAMIDEIARTPAHLRRAIAGLTAEQLDTPYREGGWTVRQVVHHVPESHMNAYVRLKLALTEDVPTIKPYDEAKWSGTPEVSSTPLDVSLTMLDSIHARWVMLMRMLDDTAFDRKFVHPDHGPVTIDWLVQMYEWHGRHHVGHITALRTRKGW